MSRRPKVDFLALISNDVAPAISSVSEPVSSPAPAPGNQNEGKGRGTLKQRTRQQSLYLEVPVYDVLREIAHGERCSMHSLFLEGIDAVLKKRGSPSIKELLASQENGVL